MNYWTSCIVLEDNVIILAMISLAGLIQGAAVSWHGEVHVGCPFGGCPVRAASLHTLR